LVTSTEWKNWFWLRDHLSADPTIQNLAQEMAAAFKSSVATERDLGDWHLPYISDQDIEEACIYAFDYTGKPALQEPEHTQVVTEICCKLSAARCARISYLTHDKERPPIEKDLALFTRLMGEERLHASPTEHQATPDSIVSFDGQEVKWANPRLHGNFYGWKQYRKMFVGETASTSADELRWRRNQKVPLVQSVQKKSA
jgi:hypothetical protein